MPVATLRRPSRTSLSRDLTSLARLFGRDWLTADRETVGLSWKLSLWLDVKVG